MTLKNFEVRYFSNIQFNIKQLQLYTDIVYTVLLTVTFAVLEGELLLVLLISVLEQ